MRTNEERQQLIHRRTLEIQREQQKKRERVISGSGIAACLMIIIGIGCLMPEVTKQASVSGAKTNYTTGMASMMGTLYFVLYLVIRGKVPQFFYVSEISWIASYLFLHSYQIVGYKGQRMKISVIPLICGIGVAIISIWSGIFGPAILSTGVFTLAAGAIVYISVFQILYGDAPYKSSICILLCIILQVSLYISSSFFHDYTRFNLYFCIDIVLTISMAMLLPCTFMEVGKDDVH